MISVVIPTIGSHSLEQFEEAISSALAVSPELISQVCIMDNSKNEEFQNKMKSYLERDKRIEYQHKKEQLNLAQNLNRGFEVANNDWLLFLCDDDGLFPEAFKGLNQFLDEKLAYITADFHVRDERGDHFVKRQDGVRGILGNTPKLVSTIFNKKKFDSIGGWNNDYGYFLDLIAYLELNHQFETLYLSQSLGFHRQHAENASKRSYREVGYGKSVPVVIQRGFELLETPELQRDFLFHICSYSFPHKSLKSRVANGVVRYIFRNNAWLRDS